jgi:Fe-S-cluster containining protein
MNKDETPLNPTTNDNEEISEEQRAYIIKMLERLMELGIGAVYGDEEDGSEVTIDHGEILPVCRALCCSFVFALTKEEVQKGHIQWDRKRPYFIARDEDGFCLHLDRKTLTCSIWEERPRRCRQYDCRQDPNVWTDWGKKVVNPHAFDHLPETVREEKVSADRKEQK